MRKNHILSKEVTSMTQQQFDTAVKLIDAANSEDPNLETSDGKDWPKELLYSARMADMINRYDAEADEAPKLAVRAQHMVPDPRTHLTGAVDVGEPLTVVVEVHGSIEGVRQPVREILSGFHVTDPDLEFVGASLADGVHHEASVR